MMLQPQPLEQPLTEVVLEPQPLEQPVVLMISLEVVLEPQADQLLLHLELLVVEQEPENFSMVQMMQQPGEQDQLVQMLPLVLVPVLMMQPEEPAALLMI